MVTREYGSAIGYISAECSRAALASSSSSALGTPARMWLLVPSSRAAPSSPAPDRVDEDGAEEKDAGMPPKLTIEQDAEEGGRELTARQLSRLEHVLERSNLYSAILEASSWRSASKAKGTLNPRSRPVKRRRVVDSDASDNEEHEAVEDKDDVRRAPSPSPLS
ncbi:hypothetical protein C8R45DRAFT_1098286 [Mycena sanguinolenta]|nr:hypothetical protein C8R45DRAFT_1098286 [Mycena sanguinolenta]